MQRQGLVKPVVLVPFACPACRGANETHLITLSRKGGLNCASCKRWLRINDIMRAIHAPRAPTP